MMNPPKTLLSVIATGRKQSIRLFTNNPRAIMKSKLRIVEIRKDREIELPNNAVPVKLEQVIEPTGLVNPSPSSERFVLYYLEKER